MCSTAPGVKVGTKTPSCLAQSLGVRAAAVVNIILTGFVAQKGLSSELPLPQTDLAYGDGTRYAKSCEAI